MCESHSTELYLLIHPAVNFSTEINFILKRKTPETTCQLAGAPLHFSGATLHGREKHGWKDEVWSGTYFNAPFRGENIHVHSRAILHSQPFSIEMNCLVTSKFA